MTRPSIYDAAGGMPAFEALAAAHHARCLADPLLEHPFSHTTNPDHVHRLAAYWSEVLGGPAEYSAVASQRSLLRIHASNGAEDELGARFLDCFVAALDDAGIPAEPTLRAALHDYMGWAVTEFMAYAPYGSAGADGRDRAPLVVGRGAAGARKRHPTRRPRLASTGDVLRPWYRHRDHLQRRRDPSRRARRPHGLGVAALHRADRRRR